MPPGPQPGTPLAGLRAALDTLADVDPHGLSDDDLATAMIELRRQAARLGAVTAELSAAFDTRRVWAEDGSRGAARILAVRGNVGHTVLAQLREMIAVLLDLP